MKKGKLPKPSFAHLAVLFAVVGIIVLYSISSLSEPEHIRLDEIPDHVGEDVVVQGVVIDHETTVRGDAELLIYGDTTTLEVVVEDYDKNIEINRMIKLQGEVREFRDQYELVAVTDSSIEVIGEYETELVLLADMGEYLNQYISIEGVIVDEYIYGGGGLYLDLFQNNRIVTVYLDKYYKYVELTGLELNITDTVKVSGIVRETSSGHKLIVYNENSVELTGHWQIKQLSIENITLQTQLTSQQVARELASNPSEFGTFPVEITGYVKYEPMYGTSFYISEKPIDGTYSLKIKTNDCNLSKLHKGDKVNLAGNLVYDLKSLRYFVEAFYVELVEPYGNWTVSFEELVRNSYEYLNATVNISGYVYRLWDERFFYLVDSNQSYNFSLRVYVYDFNVTMPEHDEYVEVTAEFIYYERFLCYEILVRNPWELRRVEH